MLPQVVLSSWVLFFSQYIQNFTLLFLLPERTMLSIVHEVNFQIVNSSDEVETKIVHSKVYLLCIRKVALGLMKHVQSQGKNLGWVF